MMSVFTYKDCFGGCVMNLYVVNSGLVLFYKEGSVNTKWIEFRYIYNVLFCCSLLNNLEKKHR